MLLEVEVAAEALLTDLARERLLLVVSVHVEGQVVDLKQNQFHFTKLIIYCQFWHIFKLNLAT